MGQVTHSTEHVEERIALLEQETVRLREQVARLQAQYTAASEVPADSLTSQVPNIRQVREQLFRMFPELRLLLRILVIIRMIPRLPRLVAWASAYWACFARLVVFGRRDSPDLATVRSITAANPVLEMADQGGAPEGAARRLYMRTVSSWCLSMGSPVNLQERELSDDAIRADVAHTVDVAKLYLGNIPGGTAELRGKVVLEIGPGVNYGCALLMACLGARIIVADRFLPLWDELYHPRYYSALLDWITSNMLEADVAPLRKLLACGEHCPEVVGCVPTALEDLTLVPDSSVDIVLSNAVLEHLYDPERALANLARFSRHGALGLHQVDFRDHRSMDRPLEFLLLGDADFAREFEERHGECGNRIRPSELKVLFEKAGFRVVEFEPNILAEDSYLEAFISRLRAAEQSKYREVDAGDLRVASGLFTVVRKY